MPPQLLQKFGVFIWSSFSQQVTLKYHQIPFAFKGKLNNDLSELKKFFFFNTEDEAKLRIG